MRPFLSVFALILVSVAQVPVSFADEGCAEWAARVVSVQGRVEHRAEGEAVWSQARAEVRLCPGDALRTGANSRAAVLLQNETLVRLDQLTTVNLPEPPAQAQNFLLDIIQGVGYFFSRTPKRIEFRSPFVNAAVEGTEFLVSVVPGEVSRVAVFEGKVRAFNAKGELLLTSGEEAAAGPGEAPTKRLIAKPRDAVAWALYYPPVVDYSSLRAPAEIRTAVDHFGRGDSTGALAALDRVPSNRRGAELHTLRASLLLYVGQVQAAQVDLDAALRKDPGNADALALQSIVALVVDTPEQAYRLARQATDSSPRSSAPQIALSYVHQSRFDLEQARESASSATELDPRNALAWARLAELDLALGELDPALQAAERAGSLNPNLSRTKAILGYAQLMRVDTREAEKSFEAAIKLDQADPLPRLGLGLAKIRRGKLPDGRADIEIAVSLDPENSLLRSYMGKAYFEEKRNPLAASQYEIAKQLDSLDPTPWLYSAFLKQTSNRPVEALGDLERSIERNNNRAVYRSRFLLDQDLAVRNATLGNVYRNLGFEQAALVEGWKSVEHGPVNYSAHRLLADTYSVLPRHEIARDSELLQSQLLQPINTNPVFPLLGTARSGLLFDSNIPAIGYNEYSLLFASNETRLRLDGSVGNHDTLANNATLYGVQNRLSYSVGQFHLETNGIRENDDLNWNLYNAFIQATLSHRTSVQLQAQTWEKDTGDRYQFFFPDTFSTTLRNSLENYFVRAGLRHDFTPNSTLIASFIHRDLSEDLQDLGFGLATEGNGRLFEVRHLYQKNQFNLTGGLGYLDGKGDVSITFDPVPPRTEDFTTHVANGYLYSKISPAEDFTLILGASFDSVQELNVDETQLNPKAGFSWNVSPNTTLRGAAFRVLKRPFLINQTVEPTNIAGFNQFFDDATGTEAWRYGVGLDQKLFGELLGGAEFSKRDLQVPVNSLVDPDQVVYDDEQEELGRAYLYWTPTNYLALTGEYEFQRFDRNPQARNDDLEAESRTHRFPFGLRVFLPSGPFFGTSATYVHQRGRYLNAEYELEDGRDSFWTVDAFLGYRLPKRRGVVYLNVANLFDNEFKFQDTDPTNPQIIPERAIQAAFSLTF